MMSAMLVCMVLSQDRVCGPAGCYDAANFGRLRLGLQLRLRDLERAEPYAADRIELSEIRADIRQLRQQLWDMALRCQQSYATPYVDEGYDPPSRPRIRGGLDVEWPYSGRGIPDRDCPVCPQIPRPAPRSLPYDPYSRPVPTPGVSARGSVRY